MSTLEAAQECPFLCGREFGSDEEYALALHIEEEHTEDSPFVVRNDTPLAVAAGVGPTLRLPPPHHSESQEQGKRSTSDSKKSVQCHFVTPEHTSADSTQQLPLPSRDEEVDDPAADSAEPSDEYVLCPEEGCGEEILLFEYSDHLDLHLAEKANFEDFPSSAPQSSSSNKMQSSLPNQRPDDYSSSSSSVPVSDAPSASASAATAALPPPQSHMDNFSTSISPSLRQKFAGSSSNTRSKDVGVIRRAFHSPSGEKKRKGGKLARLGVSRLCLLRGL